MIEILRKIWRFAGEEQKNIRTSVIGCFFFAVFHMFQMAAIYVVVLALVDGSTSSAPAWQALGLLLVSIIGRAIVNRFTQLQQTHAGYFMVANKRIAIGDKLKRVPMGYFNDKSLGELTGITTTVLDEVENTGPMVLVNILSGLINSLVMLLFVLVWDWRLGLLALAGMALYFLLLSAMERKSAVLAPKRQAVEAKMVKRARGILSREVKKSGREPGRSVQRFLGGITWKGVLCNFDTVEALCSRVYELSDTYGLGHHMLSYLAAGAMAAGYDVIACPSPLYPDRLEHLLIPELSLAFVTSTPALPYPRRPYRRIRLDAMADQEVLRRGKPRLRFSRKVLAALLEEAVSSLAEAKAMHDGLEELYNPYVDFERVYAAAGTSAAQLLGEQGE